MKLLGIDYGRRRIGIAVTDETGEFIKGLPTFDRNNNPEYLPALCSIIAGQGPQRIVVGLPLDINGGETVMSKEIRQFASRLGALTGIPLAFVDETLSSTEASKLVRFRKKKDRRAKGVIDRIAACLILTAYQKGLTCS